jgi:hypothetical protein
VRGSRPGAVLVHCDNEGPGYTLLVPDSRRASVWFLAADTRADAVHAASYALIALVAAVQGAYG